MMPPVKEPLAGLALLVIFGFLIWYNRPIESSPPFDPYKTNLAPRIIGQSDAYDYWLWKDPFEFDSVAIQKAIDQAGTRAEKKHDKKPQDLTCRSSLQKVISDISAKKRSVKILAPLVRVSPDTVENKEMRTRQRYAVVAGLIESGYRPQEPGLLHFCSTQGSHEYDMRWEHYKYGSKDNSKPDIVVTWIDSEILTAEDNFPANHPWAPSCNFPIKDLLKAISGATESYLFDLNDILGHDRSNQINDHIKRINHHIKLIKPAGMDSEAKSQEPSQKPTGKPEECDNQNANKNADENADGKTGNQKLAEKLAEELKLRGIKEPPKEVIIITERDSENAVTLTNDLQNCLARPFVEGTGKHECGKQKPDNSSGGTSADKTKNVFYLKGSDGNPKKIRAPDKKDKNKDENQSADKPEHVSVIDLHQSSLLPIGPGQVDYFHRLAEEIRNVHDTVDFDKRDSGAKAVVILGSDFNDKLLIIEALRDKLPHLLILTTDLDAQMLYSKHWRSTRNLVVASHFDLRLRETKDDDKSKHNERPFWERVVQDQFPPFRDSQQTNIFYRTRGIADGNASSIDQSEITFPRIFEVGRNGFVRLDGAQKNESPSYHPPDNTLKQTGWRLFLLLIIVLTFIALHWVIRPRSKTLSLYLLFGTFVIFAIAFGLGTDVFWENESKEPLSFSDGVSLWPTLFIQIIAALLAGAFFMGAICGLDQNFWHLSTSYFSRWLPYLSARLDANKNEWDECEPWLARRRHDLRQWTTRLHSHSVRGWGTFFLLIGTVGIYAWNDVYPAGLLSFWPCFIILVFFAIPYIGWAWNDVSVKHWLEDGHDIHNMSRMWWRYFRLGQLGYRSARVVAMWLIFAIIETLLAYLLPPWPLLWRSDHDPASWIGVLSFVVTMLLLFFVLDAVRLNYYWIKKLRKYHYRSQPFARRLCSNILLEALEDMVEVVAERTQAVDKLIYYPMLCIVLMLFAKITYFDNQEFPLSKGITFGAAISVLFFSGFMLRHEANQLRLSIRKDVQDRAVGVTCTRDRKQDTLTRLDTIDEGAFQPMLEQPVMQALLIVLASIGLFAGEYVKLFG